MTAPATGIDDARSSLPEPVPLVNLSRQDGPLRAVIRARIAEVIESNAFIHGRYARQFAGEFTGAIGAAAGHGCSNGTAAIALALRALKIGPGDEVITTAHSFIASSEAILDVGATPLFVDIEPESYCIDPAAIEAAVTSRTKAIVPVHIYGTPCDMDRILAVANRHGLAVIEDAAQAHLARYKGRIVGAIGDFGTFSFYPGKNLGAYGDAGFVTCRDAALAETVGKLLDHGRSSKYEHDMLGFNHRMDALQAVILSEKLKVLPQWTAHRQRAAARYDAALRPRGFKTVSPCEGADSVCHLYIVETANRDETRAALSAQGISSGVHYPIPLHLQPCNAGLGYRSGAFPVCESAADRVLSLPIDGAVTDEEIDRICAIFAQVAYA